MIEIRQIREDDAPAFREVLDAVCRERRYLATMEAPAMERVQVFVSANVKAGHPQFVAEDDGKIVGWCDAIPGEASSGVAHIGRLGMGVLTGYRGKKIGRRLIEATIEKARQLGLEKIELSVYSSNEPAILLYRSLGFVEEGRKKRGRFVDGIYDDVLLMALELVVRANAHHPACLDLGIPAHDSVLNPNERGSPVTLGGIKTDRKSVQEYYAAVSGKESARLSTSDGHIEFAITKSLIRKYVPNGAHVLDIGCGPGRYGVWLAKNGYRATLADLSPELLTLARREVEKENLESSIEGIVEADACNLERWKDGTFDAVLALGPFYHLPVAAEREAAAKEIARVLKPNGLLLAAFMSRWSFVRRVLSLADEREYLRDPRWIEDLLEHGSFRNEKPGRFTVGYGARPEEIAPFFDGFGFEKKCVVALESIAGGIAHGLEELERADPGEHERMIERMVCVGQEPSIVGFYGHILYVGKKGPMQVPQPTRPGDIVRP